jgi:arsenate reductase (glutaredoxin)
MKKIYTLANCSTSQGIIEQMGKKSSKYSIQNIKEEKITPEQLDEMKEMSGSYESLFSRRALKYKSMGLADKKLTEKDYRKLILEEYTFLKRPVIIAEKKIFVGNAPKIVQEMLANI